MELEEKWRKLVNLGDKWRKLVDSLELAIQNHPEAKQWVVCKRRGSKPKPPIHSVTWHFTSYVQRLANVNMTGLPYYRDLMLKDYFDLGADPPSDGPTLFCAEGHFHSLCRNMRGPDAPYGMNIFFLRHKDKIRRLCLSCLKRLDVPEEIYQLAKEINRECKARS